MNCLYCNKSCWIACSCAIASCKKRGLSLVSSTLTPIRFVAAGWTCVAENLMVRLMAAGFYPNLSTFPAVPQKQAGIRITITRHQSEDDIRALVEALARHLPLALEEEGSSFEELTRFFSRVLPAPVLAP
jgi:hypothetical protein